ncbi:uncharacterized protein LOC105700384 [Orussus abietinus]|uniref:uncharacterized protein LOC105700384 n=1 Tax=Orussus abietinus TaxID=222816 RepID=UPI00062506F2|nr:uncharacterized protein LOC105700384 [Orussus abietinus]XP_012281607.1 uncharacterized protein LOC105700384 [Orussus abietinus]XP_023290268.1 uncharacterized protein LOC105700384 [Orussus abietinus]
MLQAVRLLTELTRPTEYGRRNEGTMDTRTSASEGPVLFREIHKNGWLRRTDKSEKEVNRFWVTFCIHDDTEPRLEGFGDQKQATVHSPLWAHSLRNVLHVSPTLCATQRNDFEFCVNFNDDQVLRLAAPTYQAMCDWVQAVTRKLTDMKILQPKENIYSKGPERVATRDPTSPLPPPPTPIGSVSIQRSLSQGSSTSLPGTSNSGRDARLDTTPMIFTFDDIPAEDRRGRPVQAQVQRTTPPLPSPRPIPSPRTLPTSVNDDPGNSSYESVFMASSYSPLGDTVRRESRETDASEDRYAALMEYRSTGSSESRSHSRSASGRPGLSNVRRQLTLREQQVYQLIKEMSHPAGVRLQLGRRDCKDSIAFVDTFGAVWVAGWKQREHPLLYNALHVGDMVLSVAGISPPGATVIRDILKGCTTPRVEVIVRRLPYGRAMTLTRRAEGEDFGLEVNGNEVTSVTGIAQGLGFPPLAPSSDPAAPSGSTVTWTLTEVNGRPLNIFEGGARERLGAVGRDVSIVIQPTDFVGSLRKRLRSVRSYKNYVVQ